MSVHVEWLEASEALVELIPPDADWVGADLQGPDEHVLAVDYGSDIAAIYGSLEDLRSFAHRLLRATGGTIPDDDEQPDG